VNEIFERKDHRIVARWGGETIWLEPCGANGARVRTTRNREIDEATISALLDTDSPDASWDFNDQAAILTNGRLHAQLRLVSRGMGPALELRFLDAVTGSLLLEEEMPHILWPGTRHCKPQDGNLWHVEQRFKAQDGEQFFGLGQHQHGKFNQKGCVIDLAQANTEISIPFLVSSHGYGLIWNNPGVGRVELAENRTLWVMEATPQLDYVVIAGATPAVDPCRLHHPHRAPAGTAGLGARLLAVQAALQNARGSASRRARAQAPRFAARLPGDRLLPLDQNG
jgi:alpha-D-xyloside xylohydrolase